MRILSGSAALSDRLSREFNRTIKARNGIRQFEPILAKFPRSKRRRRRFRRLHPILSKMTLSRGYQRDSAAGTSLCARTVSVDTPGATVCM
ncbi:hypothetical protein NSE01_14990 [Novosphingobium sediminis]|uniref:Uncharacterized protein n=1 Tax=Novosphingobium sediminis TaxID=707214 RepID=A0A512AJ00_9SPHN|nr:hypothetical protein NSE01_14990 [Novosphingobium sediminis]